jgi:hypothetical protein
MADTTEDVRRDIEITRERMSDTISQIEQKLNLAQIIRDHPWQSLAIAIGAGLALGSSGADRKAAAATLAATRGSTTKLGAALDDIVANVMTGVHTAVQDRVDGWVSELKSVIGAPVSRERAYGASPQAGAGFGSGAVRESPGFQPGTARRAD